MKKNLELKPLWPWKMFVWERRTQAVAEIIPPEASILELGGGWCLLAQIMPENKYQSIDIQEWTDVTTKADFNKGEYPDLGLFDVIVAQGTIEYIENPGEFLNRIKKYGRRLIISYKLFELSATNVKLRKNRLSFDDFETLLIASGWWKGSERDLDEKEKIYYCTKI